MAGEGEVVLSSSGFSSVTIWCTKLDHNFDNSFNSIQIARSAAQQDSQEKPDTFIIDIGRIKEAITIQGYLIDETTESAVTKKWNLAKLVRYCRAVTISWGTGNNQQLDKDKNEALVGNINKCMVTETPGIVGTQQSNYYSEKNFAVQIAIVLGTDKMS